MKSDAKNPSAPSRTRRKAAAQAAPAESPVSAPAPAAPADNQNVGSIESALSLAAGVLLVVSALFPRSLKQLLLLGLGGGMLYRGMTRMCGVYKAVGIDTAKGSLLEQLNDKLQARRS